MIDNTQAADIANMIGVAIIWIMQELAFLTVISVGFATVLVLLIRGWINLLRDH